MAQSDVLRKIKKLRKERGLSQSHMADALHIALKTYQNIEGGITRIDIERLDQIARILQTRPEELLGDEARSGAAQGFTSEEKELYHKIIHDKEAYIAQLEDSIRFYRQLLRDYIPF
jgi:Predicted transcriptional regulators